MIRRKQNNPTDDVNATLESAPNGTGAVHTSPETAVHESGNGGARRPRRRKSAEAEVEVIAVRAEPPRTPDLKPSGPDAPGARIEEFRQQSQEATRLLQDMRAEAARVAAEVQTFRQQALDAGKAYQEAGQRLLEEGRQRSESLRQQFQETQGYLDTVLQLFREAGLNLVVVFGEHLEQIKQHAQESGRQTEAARQEAAEARQQLQQVREQAREARELYETAQREAQQAGQQLSQLRQQIQDSRSELEDARREWEVVREELHNRTTKEVSAPAVEEKPRLGVTVDPVAVVSEVEPATPAEQSGLQPGDVITRVNDRAITNADELRDVINQIPAGEEVTLEVVRGNETKVFRAQLPRG